MTKLVRNHSHWGAFLAEVEDGRIVGVRPFERDPDPSPMIEAVPDAVHSKTRVAQPMVREGWLKNGNREAMATAMAAAASRSCRCRGSARSISSRASCKRVKRDHGHDAIMAGSQGWGFGRNFPRGARTIAPLHGDVRRLRRPDLQLQLRHRAGFSAACDRQRPGGHRAAHVMVVDRAPRQADGAVRRRQSEEHAGDQGRHAARTPSALRSPSSRAPESRSSMSARSARTGRPTSRRNGSRSGPAPIPRCCWRWSIRWSPNGLHDADFLARYCTGFERVRAYVMGESDGQPKDADWAAAITGVPAETIRALAREMAAKRTMISASWSLQRADHGEQPYWARAAACLLSRPDRPARRRLRFRLWLDHGHRRTAAGVPRAGHGGRRQPAQPRHSGGADRAVPAASRRALRLQRPAEHLSGYQAGVLGRRQSVPPSPGHQPAARRLPPAADHHRA